MHAKALPQEHSVNTKLNPASDRTREYRARYHCDWATTPHKYSYKLQAVQGWRGFHVLLLPNKLAKYGLDLQRDYYACLCSVSLCLCLCLSLSDQGGCKFLTLTDNPPSYPIQVWSRRIALKSSLHILSRRMVCVQSLSGLRWNPLKCTVTLRRTVVDGWWVDISDSTWSRRMLCDTKQPTTTVLVGSLVSPQIHKPFWCYYTLLQTVTSLPYSSFGELSCIWMLVIAGWD